MKTLTLLLVLMSLTTMAFASKAEWEDLGSDVFRTKTPHGWILITKGINTPLLYVPDENHEWRLSE